MAVLDEDISFIEPDRLTLTRAAHKHIEDQRGFIDRERPDSKHIATLNIGLEGPWLAFCTSNELSADALPFVSKGGLLVAFPLRLEIGETLVIDFAGDNLIFRGLDLADLIPDELRQAFAEKLDRGK
jgi:hypothetical protein